MRQRQSDAPFSIKAYYFGLISLVLYLTQATLQWVKHINDRNAPEAKLPDFLLWICLFVLFFTSILCMYYTARGAKERSTFKGTIGRLLAIACAFFLIKVGLSLV